jgi:hypothetical protein
MSHSLLPLLQAPPGNWPSCDSKDAAHSTAIQHWQAQQQGLRVGYNKQLKKSAGTGKVDDGQSVAAGCSKMRNSRQLQTAANFKYHWA